MKTFTAFFAFVLCLFISVNGMAQVKIPITTDLEPKLKTDVVGSYPTEIWEYMWIVEYWSVHQQSYITYTSFGEPSEKTIVGQDGDFRTQYTYDSQQRLILTMEQKKENQEWVDDRREVTEYDEYGNLSLMTVETKMGTEWVIEFGSKDTYTMDGDNVAGMISQIWSRGDNAWINLSRIAMSYNDEMTIIEIIMETWEDGAWENSGFFRQTMEDGRLIEVMMSGWEDEAWLESTKFIYEYADFDSMTMTVFTFSEGNWVPSQRLVDNLDSHGNVTLSTVEIYTMEWMMLSGSKYFLTYDGNNVTERITQTYSMFEPADVGATFTGTWKNVYKEEFKDFASLSSNPIILEPESVSHFPNPANENVNIMFKNLKDKDLRVTLMSLTGEVVIQENIFVPADNFRFRLNLDKLPAGTFIIMTRDTGGKLISSSSLIHQK